MIGSAGKNAIVDSGVFSAHDSRLFRRRLLRWYAANQRDLPWRSTRDPYRIWVSEIMLQQTRVAVVVEYYARFVRSFPDVQALASAPLSSVLACWSGLGYYRRARMMHQAAKEMLRSHNGRLPATAEALRTLPGIGRYTAGAIASIAFGEPVPVVDGNVQRVTERMCGRELPREQVWAMAEALLGRRAPGDFNQAMMELGATVCLPRDPKCLLCPLASLCRAKGPLTKPRRQARRKQDISFLLDCRHDSVFLVRRPKGAALMAGMWELPEIADLNGNARWTLKHSVTVTDYTVRVAEGEVPAGSKGQRIACTRLAAIPLTGVTRKILRAANVI